MIRGDEKIRLTPKEFELLVFLAQHPGRVLTHRAILKAIWGPHAVDQPEHLRVLSARCGRRSKPIPRARATSSPSRGSAIGLLTSDSAASSARFSISTLTRGSPRNPELAGLRHARDELPHTPRPPPARGRRGDLKVAPLPATDADQARTRRSSRARSAPGTFGIGACQRARRSAATRRSASVFVGPRFEPARRGRVVALARGRRPGPEVSGRGERLPDEAASRRLGRSARSSCPFALPWNRTARRR